MDDGYIALIVGVNNNWRRLLASFCRPLFEWVGLRTNTTKTKGWLVSSQQGTPACQRRYTATVGLAFTHKVLGILMSYNMIDEDKLSTWCLPIQGSSHQLSTVNMASTNPGFSTIQFNVQCGYWQLICPVSNCVGSLARPWNLCKHFIDRYPVMSNEQCHWCGILHWQVSSVSSYEQCDRCGMQTSPKAFNITHYSSALCCSVAMEECGDSARGCSDISTSTCFGDIPNRIQA